MYEIAKIINLNKYINHEKELPYYQNWDFLQPVLIEILFRCNLHLLPKLKECSGPMIITQNKA